MAASVTQEAIRSPLGYSVGVQQVVSTALLFALVLVTSTPQAAADCAPERCTPETCGLRADGCGSVLRCGACADGRECPPSGFCPTPLDASAAQPADAAIADAALTDSAIDARPRVTSLSDADGHDAGAAELAAPPDSAATPLRDASGTSTLAPPKVRGVDESNSSGCSCGTPSSFNASAPGYLLLALCAIVRATRKRAGKTRPDAHRCSTMLEQQDLQQGDLQQEEKQCKQ